MAKYLAAVCQMDTQDDKEQNLKTAEAMIDEAAGRGASLIAFPETMNYMGKGYREMAEAPDGETTAFFCRKAAERGVWIVTGSFPEEDASGKPKNTMLLVDPEGNVICRYSKLHMFDVDIANGPSNLESAENTAGDEIVLADTALGRIGFALCYDLRFGEMFRLMALAGAKVICVPSGFMLESGKDHWEPLLRARAIENAAYLIAPNQTGRKGKKKCYGNSMVVDPWGTVIARAGERPGVILAEIDPAYADDVKRQIPAPANRREDVYTLASARIKIYP